MEEEYSTEPVGTVDPEVRAHVTSLVSAVSHPLPAIAPQRLEAD